MNTIENVFTSGKTIPIVFATDKKFVPYMSVAITSLIENSSPENNYDIVILYNDIDKYNQNKLENLCTENISIRFFNMSEIMKQYKDLWYIHWHYSEAMYYRFIIPQIFSNYQKVLYLDGDIVINCDIAELYDINIENNWIGAIIENSMKHPKSPAFNYIEKTLKLDKNKYFSSGIMVFNIEQLSKINLFEKCISVLKDLKTPLFPDQDVLNIICNNHTKYIDITYNLQWNIINYYKNIETYIPQETVKQIEEAKKHPKIIHYCGAFKAWKRPDLPYAEYFWHYARKSPFYEEILFENLKKSSNTSKNEFESTIRNVVYRHRIYAQYLRCKILKIITFGKTKKHYTEKSNKLKQQVKNYRKILAGKN